MTARTENSPPLYSLSLPLAAIDTTSVLRVWPTTGWKPFIWRLAQGRPGDITATLQVVMENLRSTNEIFPCFPIELAAGGELRIREEVLERDYCLAWFLRWEFI
jgi:hypothetical protein